MKGDETPIPAGGGDLGVPVVPVMESGPYPDCFLPSRTSAQPLTRKARLRPLIPRLRLRHDRPDSSSQWPVGAARPSGFLDAEPVGVAAAVANIGCCQGIWPLRRHPYRSGRRRASFDGAALLVGARSGLYPRDPVDRRV